MAGPADDYYGYNYDALENYSNGGGAGPIGPDELYYSGQTDTGKEYTGGPDSKRAGENDIGVIRRQIMGEQPGTADERGDQFANVATMLSHVQSQLRGQTESLKAEWDSPAAKDAFLSKVGETLAYLAVWENAASRTASGLHGLAAAMREAQEDMRALWAEYKQDLRDVNSSFQHEVSMEGYSSAAWEKALDKSHEKYNQKARELASRTADSYAPYITKLALGRAMKVDPLNAIQHPGALGLKPPKLPAAPGGPGGPGGMAPPDGAPGGPNGFAPPGGPNGAAPPGGDGPGAPAGAPPPAAAPPGAPKGSAPPGQGPGMPPGTAPPNGGPGQAPPGRAPGAPPGTAPPGQPPLGTPPPGRAPGMPDGVTPAGKAPGGPAPGAPPSLPGGGGAPEGSAPPALAPPTAPGTGPVIGHPSPGAPIGTPAPGAPGAPGTPGMTAPGDAAPGKPPGTINGTGAPGINAPNAPGTGTPPGTMTPPPPGGSGAQPPKQQQGKILGPRIGNPGLATPSDPEAGTIRPPAGQTAPPPGAPGSPGGRSATGSPGSRPGGRPATGSQAEVPEAFLPPPNAAPSVLGGEQRRTRPGSNAESPDRHSGRSDVPPPVLSNPHRTGPLKTFTERRAQRKREREKKLKPQPTSEFAVDLPLSTAPVLEARTAPEVDVQAELGAQVPAALRDRPSVLAAHEPEDIGADRAARRTRPAETPADQDLWEVETPGGPVVNGEAEYRYRPEPEPTLNGKA
ncbi:WXG100 family type VII secretion target [Saccharopolyspora sp. 5N102]|uniref:WXG100 family type VII secretion target n=1 Tax=Saccharopolyspora sp. 5N102 TaxID=3375155 RepID=UPI0037B6C20E